MTTMELATIVWLALLVVLGVLFVVTARRMSALAARTRDLERFQRVVDSIAQRLAAVVDPLVRGLDDARRHAGDPAALREQATRVETVIAELTAETQALAAPAGAAWTVPAMTSELERAGRAASLIEHGLGTLSGGGMGRDLEAQTSLKRGALNLRQAQEAFAVRAREVAALRPADLIPGAAGRAAHAPPTTPAAPGADDV